MRPGTKAQSGSDSNRPKKGQNLAPAHAHLCWKVRFCVPDFYANFMLLNQICATPKFNKNAPKIYANFYIKKRKNNKKLTNIIPMT